MMSFPVSVNTNNPPPKSPPPPKSLKLSLTLPEDVIKNCFTCVPRCDHPSLSLVSKTFNHFIASYEINILRSRLQHTENVIYIALRFIHEQNPIWYTLNQKPYRKKSKSYNYKLVPFLSFPSLPCWGSSVIVIGQEIYVLGGCVNGVLTSNAFVINARLNTRRDLPSMRVARGCAAFGVLDGKIYVIGGCKKLDSLDNWIEVFNLEKETWDCFSGLYNDEVHEITLKSFVMNEKIYIMDRKKSFVYDPKEGRWQSEHMLNIGWKVGSCVIDNMLYTFDFENRISIYDPSARLWRFLKGVEDLAAMDYTRGSRMVNHGGNLAILSKIDDNGETNIWCIEIAVERSGGDIWGRFCGLIL